MIHQQIAGDAGEPRGERAESRPVTRERAIDAQEYFLAEVLGFGRIAGEPVAQIENAPGVAAHKFLPGRPFAPETSLHQLGVGLQSSLASQLAYPFSLTRCNAIRGQKVPLAGRRVTSSGRVVPRRLALCRILSSLATGTQAP